MEDKTLEGFNPKKARDLNLKILTCEILLGITAPSSIPSNVLLEPTDRCNWNCRQCPHSLSTARSQNEMTLNTVSKLGPVLEFSEFVEFGGLGEPTIAKHFPKISEMALRSQGETYTLSNGSTLAHLKALGSLKRIGISFDGDNKRTFEALRLGANFDLLIRTIKDFRKDHPEIFLYLSATINRVNLDEMVGIAKLASDLKLQAVTFHRMYPTVPAMASLLLTKQDKQIFEMQIEQARNICKPNNILVLDYTSFDSLLDETVPLDKEALLQMLEAYQPPAAGITQSTPAPAEEREVEFRNRNTKTIAELERRLDELLAKLHGISSDKLTVPYCLAPWFRLVVKADSRMFPCCVWSMAYAKLDSSASFEEAWQSSQIVELRNSFLGNAEIPDFCSRCDRSERYQGLPEFVRSLKLLDLNYKAMIKSPSFKPPSGKFE